jgi:hypothetical protein
MITLPAIFALVVPRSKNILLFALVFVVFVLAIGLRENIGMDWNNYLAIHQKMRFYAFRDIIFDTEAASNALFWISRKFYSGIYTTNIVAAVILVTGVLVFAARTAEPWLSVLVATPYIVIVIGMSATRQAMAIGIIFSIFAFWHDFGMIRKAAMIFVASLFHTSAIFIGGFMVQDLPVNMTVRIVVGLIVVAAGVYVLSRAGIYSGQLDFYAESYLSTEGQIVSPGALAHVALVALPAAIYLIVRDKVFAHYDRSGFLDMSAMICLALVPAAFVFSTAASRFSVYMQFFPMIFYPVLADIMKTEGNRTIVRLGVIGLNYVFLLVWLRFANNSFAYLPYRSIWSE